MFVINLVSDSPTAEVLVATIRVCHKPLDCAKFSGLKAVNLGDSRQCVLGLALAAS